MLLDLLIILAYGFAGGICILVLSGLFGERIHGRVATPGLLPDWAIGSMQFVGIGTCMLSVFLAFMFCIARALAVAGGAA